MSFKRNSPNAQVFRDLEKRSSKSIVFYIILLFIVLITDNYYQRHIEFATRFIAFITIISSARLALFWVSKQIPLSYKPFMNLIFILGVLLTSLIWGIGFAKFMIQPEEAEAKMLMVMCTVGLCSGGVVTLIPEYRLAMSFCLLMLIPAIVSMAYLGTNPSIIIALIIFLFYLSIMGKQGNKEYWDALENEHLLKEKTIAIEKMSRVDSLTGLYNRRFFDEAFSFEWEKAIRNESPVTIILCDVDHFKQVNDKYGHPAGDEYLKYTGNMLKNVFKRKTDIVARYGGEEFIILVYGITCDHGAKRAEIIRSNAQKMKVSFENQIIQTTMSLGVASCVPKPNSHKEDLVTAADKCLYQSKESGRNKVTRSL